VLNLGRPALAPNFYTEFFWPKRFSAAVY